MVYIGKRAAKLQGVESSLASLFLMKVLFLISLWGYKKPLLLPIEARPNFVTRLFVPSNITPCEPSRLMIDTKIRSSSTSLLILFLGCYGTMSIQVAKCLPGSWLAMYGVKYSKMAAPDKTNEVFT